MRSWSPSHVWRVGLKALDSSLIDIGGARKPLARPTARKPRISNLVAPTSGLRHRIVIKPTEDARIESHFNLRPRFFSVLEADRTNTEFLSCALSVHSSIESGLADMISDVAQIVGIAGNRPRGNQSPPVEGQ
jgi:hypothetical protein